MRAVRYHEAGDPSVLRVEDIERPTPGPDEVLLEVRAASVNPVDAKFREWGIPDGPKTTGSDAAGVVVSVGDDVEAFETGDRAFATGLHTTRFEGGSFAEYAVVPTDLLAALPDEVSFEEGAAAALVGVTAWRALVDHAAIEPGETAFVHGGNGGVGHVTVGLADAMGVSSVASARPEYHGALERFGAESVVDYSRSDFTEAARTATGGADAVLDHMPATYLGTDVELAAFGGDIVVIAGGETTVPDISAGRVKELTVHLMSMSNLAIEPSLPDIGPILDKLARLLADDRLSVHIDRTLSLSEAEEAHRAVLEDSFLGKIVVVP
jgi:NADPH:quinone reductase-like Zn-dependent oxidoreductase